MINIILPKTESNDLIPLSAGRHDCPSSHSYGPHVRDDTIIHLCLCGSGRLFNSRGEHKVKAGQLFIIRKGEITTYTADKEDPWHYVWISFIGGRASIFENTKDVYDSPRGFAERLSEYVMAGVRSPDIYISLLYELMYELLTKEPEPQDKLTEIHRYIKYEYMRIGGAADVAREFGFDRSYLYRIFKARYGTGIKSYITKVRMTHAETMLRGGSSVSDTAVMVGYSDEFNFSKAYKKYFGYPPSRSKPTDRGVNFIKEK